jgi:hypothetical protein
MNLTLDSPFQLRHKLITHHFLSIFYHKSRWWHLLTHTLQLLHQFTIDERGHTTKVNQYQQLVFSYGALLPE